MRVADMPSAVDGRLFGKTWDKVGRRRWVVVLVRICGFGDASSEWRAGCSLFGVPQWRSRPFLF